MTEKKGGKHGHIGVDTGSSVANTFFEALGRAVQALAPYGNDHPKWVMNSVT